MGENTLDKIIINTASDNGLYESSSIDLSKIKNTEDTDAVNKLLKQSNSIEYQIDDMEECAKYFLQEMDISLALNKDVNSLEFLSAQLLQNLGRLKLSLIRAEVSNTCYYSLICGQLFQKINFIYLWEPAALAKKKNTEVLKSNSEINAKLSGRADNSIQAHKLATRYLSEGKQKANIVSLISQKMSLSSKTIRRYLETHSSNLWVTKKK